MYAGTQLVSHVTSESCARNEKRPNNTHRNNTPQCVAQTAACERGCVPDALQAICQVLTLGSCVLVQANVCVLVRRHEREWSYEHAADGWPSLTNALEVFACGPRSGLPQLLPPIEQSACYLHCYSWCWYCRCCCCCCKH